MATAEHELVRIARQQHGAFTLAQARGAGLSERQVARRVERGHWVRIGRGVLAVDGTPTTWQRRAIAPLLLRPDAALAERSAAHLHGALAAPLLRPALIVPPGTSARVGGTSVVHRLHLPPADVTIVDGLRCTTPARTLVDLASVLGPKALGAAVDTALHRRSTTPRAVDRSIERATHLRAVDRAALLGALEAWRGIRPGSPAEVRLLRQVAEWGLPAPERQVPILDPDGQILGRADLGWPPIHFGLEYDGGEHHGPNRWRADEERHARIAATGWTLVHLGARDLLPGSDLRRRLLRHLGALVA